VALGERAHDLGVLCDEGGVDALVLDELADELVEEARRRARLGALDAVLGAEALEDEAGLLGEEVRGELDVERVLDALHHGDAPEGRGEVDRDGRLGLLRAVGVVGDDVGAADGLDHAGDHVLGHAHEVVVVGVGHVELARGELGVVREVDALVAELAAQLVDAVEAADDELLEVELGRDAHEEVEVEVVVVRDEGPGGRPSRDHVHHGRLDLDESALVKVPPHVVDDLRALLEGHADVVVEEEVEVALAVARLLVDEAVEGLGEHVQAGREDGERLGEDGQLALLALAGAARHADDVPAAHIVAREVVGGLVLRPRRVEHDLHLLALAVEVVELELGRGGPHRHHAPGDAHGHVAQDHAVGDAGEGAHEGGELREDGGGRAGRGEW
jgi:hypothetical protein